MELDIPLLHTLEGHNAEITVLAWSFDCTYLASAGKDRIIKVWNMKSETPDVITLEGHCDDITSLSWYPRSNKVLVSRSKDSTIKLWSIPNRRYVRDIEQCTIDHIALVAWSPNRRYLAYTDFEDIGIWSGKRRRYIKYLNDDSIIGALCW